MGCGCWGVGQTGRHGDVLVTTDRETDPYRNLIEAREADVAFVAINGYPFYGTTQLMTAAGAVEDEPIRLRGVRRRIRLKYTGIPDADLGWADVLNDLADATADPVARYLKLERAHGDPNPEKRPLWLMTDKPWDDPKVTGKPVPVTVRIPPLDPLTHDAAFFRAIGRHPVHGEILDKLKTYYT